MNLLDIRKHFRTLSGRYDLVDDDVSGTVNFLINQACRYLDRLTEHQKTWGSHFAQLAANSFTLPIPHCRAIKEVWVSTNTGTRWQLEKKNLQDLIVDYLSEQPTSDDCLYYSPVITRKIPEDADLSAFSTYLTYVETMTNVGQGFNGILLLPPTDVAVLIEVRGFYYSKELVNDTDQNFWTANHPLTLIKAALRELDIFNQNQGKTKLWNEAITVELDNISKDLVEEIVAEVDDIEGGAEGNII